MAETVQEATRAILYHSGVLKVPSLSSVKFKAKLSLLTSLNCSSDPSIQEINVVFNLSREMALKIKSIYQEVNHQQPKKSLINSTKRLVKENEKESWDGKLQTLQVQGSLLIQKRTPAADCGAESWMDYPKDSSLISWGQL